MNKVAFVTLGCKTNQYETDALMDIFYKNRYDVVDYDDFANIYVINTCTVTHVGDKKSRQMIRRAKKNNPDSLVVVCGCYAQISPNEVAAIKDVDIVIGTDSRNKILDYIATYQTGKTEKPYIIVEDIMKIKVFEEMSVSQVMTHTRAFIKIQEGCNQYCSYCIIPYARGQVRSRTLEHVLEEIRVLTAKGYQEFVLTGIHIGSYGLDLKDVNLIHLLEAIHLIEGVKRIRIGSIEPRLITDDFVHRLKELPKVCDHFHLSLQSGSESVLKRMNRKYTPDEFLASVHRLRSIYEAPSITTDLIVGFPGETEDEFTQTLNFVEKVGFSEIHVFQFSKREGTPAALMPDQIDDRIKKRRSEQLIQLGNQLSHRYKHYFNHKVLNVLIEEVDKLYVTGHSNNYLNVKVETKDQRIKQGEIIEVQVIIDENEKILGKLN